MLSKTGKIKDKAEKKENERSILTWRLRHFGTYGVCQERWYEWYDQLELLMRISFFFFLPLWLFFFNNTFKSFSGLYSTFYSILIFLGPLHFAVQFCEATPQSVQL